MFKPSALFAPVMSNSLACPALAYIVRPRFIGVATFCLSTSGRRAESTSKALVQETSLVIFLHFLAIVRVKPHMLAMTHQALDTTLFLSPWFPALLWFHVFCSMGRHILALLPPGSLYRSKRHRRRKQIKGVGSQTAARRGARSRCVAIATLVQRKNGSFLSQFRTGFVTSSLCHQLYPRCWFSAALSWAFYAYGDLSSDDLMATWLLLFIVPVPVPSRPLSPASRDGGGCCHAHVLSFPLSLSSSTGSSLLFVSVIARPFGARFTPLFQLLRLQFVPASTRVEKPQGSRLMKVSGFSTNLFLGRRLTPHFIAGPLGSVAAFVRWVPLFRSLHAARGVFTFSLFCFSLCLLLGLHLWVTSFGCGMVGFVFVLLSLTSVGVVSEFSP